MRILVVVLCLFLSACIRESADVSQEGPDRSEAAQNAPDSRTAPPAVSGDFPANQPGGVAEGKQRVELLEYQIRMPQELRAGKQSFTVVNTGKELHSFEIEGNGIEIRLPSDLPRGEETSIDVNLQPGTYTVYCPIKGHKEKGMTTQVTVR